MNDIAASIRQTRSRLGWTQAELAARSGVSRDWIISLEKAKPSQEIALVLRTLKALNLNVSLGNQDKDTWTEKAFLPSPVERVINLNDFLEGADSEGNAQ